MGSIELNCVFDTGYPDCMSQETRTFVGTRIRELRKSQKLSQQKLALMVNVERSYLAKIEGGKRNPSLECIEKISKGLGLSLEEFFKGL